MKISARNQLRGKVAAVTAGAVNTVVELQLPGGESVVSVITNESAKALDIKVGGEALALLKASSVLVMTDAAGFRLSARNCLAGTVTGLNLGPVNAEVTITLAGGEALHATITHAACSELGLTEGMPATAVFKAPMVMLAVPA